MKYILFADLHLTGKDTNYVESGYVYPSKSYTKIEIMSSILDKYKDNDINDKNVIILGDIFHEKNIVYASALYLFKSFIEKYTDWKFYIINGNHDVADSSENPLTLVTSFNGYSNVTIVDYNQYLVIGENNNVLLCGWHRHQLEFLRAIAENIDMTNINTLISHFGVNEAQLSTGIFGVSNIKFSDLSKYFQLILLGHYHKPQEIKNKNGMLYYVGSLIQENWNEANEEKRYLIFDDIEMTVESHIIDGYQKYNLIETNDINEVHENYEKFKDNLNYFKIKTTNPEVYEFCKNNNIKCFYKKSKNIMENVKVLDDSNMDIFVAYLKDKKPDLSDEEFNKYMKIKEEIIKEHGG